MKEIVNKNNLDFNTIKPKLNPIRWHNKLNNNYKNNEKGISVFVNKSINLFKSKNKGDRKYSEEVPQCVSPLTRSIIENNDYSINVEGIFSYKLDDCTQKHFERELIYEYPKSKKIMLSIKNENQSSIINSNNNTLSFTENNVNLSSFSLISELKPEIINNKLKVYQKDLYLDKLELKKDKSYKNKVIVIIVCAIIIIILIILNIILFCT